MKRKLQIAGCLALLGMGAPGLRAGPRPRPLPTEPAAVVLRGTDDAGGFLALRVPMNVFAQLQQPGGNASVNLNQIGGASVSSTLYDSANTALKVSCVLGCTASAGFTDNTAFASGATSVNNISGVFNDLIANLVSGNAGAIRATTDRMLFVNVGKIAGTAPTLTGSSLNVNCTGGCGAAATFADNSVFTAGTTGISNIGGVFNDALAAVTSGNAAAPRITAQRGLHVNLRNNAGAEIGAATTPVRTDPTGTTTQPVSGTVTSNQGGAPWTQRIQDGVGATLATVTAANALKVDGSAVTQPVSGTVTTTPPANASTNVAQFGGTNLSTGTGAGGLGIPRVTLSNDSSLAANQSVNEAQIGGVNVVSDPCQRAARTSVNISLTASAQLIAGVAAQQIYICSMNLIVSAADNVALVEGTGVTCATGIAGMAGGATAATGWNLAANGGFVNGTGSNWVFRTATAADNVCLLVSGTAQVSGSLSYVSLL